MLQRGSWNYGIQPFILILTKANATFLEDLRFFGLQVIGFSDEKVASYIAVVGVLSIVAQTAVLTLLYQALGNRNTILIGLLAQLGQLICFAFGKVEW